MLKATVISLGLLAMTVTAMAEARPGGRLRDRLGNRDAAAAVPEIPGKQTLSYGTDKLQQLDFYPAQGAKGPAPLVLYVHGGGWKRGSKDTAASRYAPGHFTGLGYAYASINYRLVPEASVEQQAEDVAMALKALLDQADRLGIDRSRVVITGHSAGAHLVALVGTDERYLRKAGLSFADLDGVLPNDGAAYDVAAQMRQAGPMMQDTYTQAFGTDPARQQALSPTLQAASPNAPTFLLIHVKRADGIAQNKGLETALRRARTPVERHEFDGRGLQGHAEINRRLGDPTYAATPIVDAWLKRVFGK